MKTFNHFLGAFALLFIVNSNLLAQYTPNNNDDDDDATTQKVVFFELFGQGFVPSINYDTRFSKSLGGFGARVGIGNFNLFGALNITTIPLVINYLKPLSRSGSYLELGAGATIVNGNFLNLVSGTGSVGTLDVGYRYQPVDGGFNFRIGITPLFGKNEFVAGYGGISMGYTIGGLRQKTTPKMPVKVNPKPEEVAVKKPDQEFTKMEDNAYHLDNVYFDQGESKLLTDSYQQLDKLAEMLQRNTKMTIRVEGHTENIGDAEANQKLSEDRAMAVREYLKNKGIVGSRVSFKGYGSSKPASKDNSIEGRRLNRRVTFVILTQ
jgi:outer membrane protein OmpA-like peptidoglycan-associated protein